MTVSSLKTLGLLCCIGGVTGCATTPLTPAETTAAVQQDLVALADPRQDVGTAILRPDDNCYWYEHQNPLETVLLPLRTIDGRHICQASA